MRCVVNFCLSHYPISPLNLAKTCKSGCMCALIPLSLYVCMVAMVTAVLPHQKYD